MERLSIPLHRTPYTTRRTWRVVGFLVFSLLFAWITLQAWYGRNTTAIFIPNDSVAILRFSINRSNQERIRSLLADFPLLSGRTITFDDLKTAIRGEFSLFFLSDGTQAVALRTEESLLPKSLLDAQGILIQQVRPHIFLLSAALMPLAEARIPRAAWIRSIHPLSKKIGTASFKEPTWISGNMYATAEKMMLFFPSFPLSKHPFSSIPEGTIAVFSTPASVPVSLNGTFRSTDRLLTQFKTPTTASLISLFAKSNGGILLTNAKTSQSLNFLFVTEGVMETNQAKNLLKTAIALKNPNLKTWELPDKTKAQEIIVDPSLISIQEYTAFGTNALRASANENESLFMASTSQYSLFSNSEDLLRDWFQPEKEAKRPSCIGNHAFLSTKDVIRLLSEGSQWIRPAVSLPFVKEYPQFSVQKGFFSLIIQFCK